MSRQYSVQLQHVLAAVGRVADQALAAGVDDEVEKLEWDLTDQHRHIVGNFHDVGCAIAALDGQAYGVVHVYGRDANTAQSALRITQVQTELLNQSCW